MIALGRPEVRILFENKSLCIYIDLLLSRACLGNLIVFVSFSDSVCFVLVLCCAGAGRWIRVPGDVSVASQPVE